MDKPEFIRPYGLTLKMQMDCYPLEALYVAEGAKEKGGHGYPGVQSNLTLPCPEQKQRVETIMV